ncbi:hypothetical protein LAZ40_03190 [Cereibacter sphaeroides]|uniref:hypothetical protein n=1 Tax=Cereibacter sphaeroides TaxID=1063 RepID=UPI001F295C81|nr:hypothetical protein [Cereibacter sphaeroides]MCE6958060.1 hypothetical protein [Cereibacter sphaeroides]MCE6971347.1 hypothetical protein [Cereibacter sphaeroides]
MSNDLQQFKDSVLPLARADLKKLWETVTDRIDEGGRLTVDCDPFPAGTEFSPMAEWFRRQHWRIDSLETCLVEIRTRGLFGLPRIHRLEARHIVLEKDRVLADGLERPEFGGKTVTALRWVSGRGMVVTHADAPVSGMINGVHMSRFRAAPDAAPQEPDHEPSLS